MSNKRKNILASSLRIVAALLMLAALLSPLADAMKMKLADSSYVSFGSGFSFIFGLTIQGNGKTYEPFGLSAIGLLAYIFAMASFLSHVSSLFLRKELARMPVAFGCLTSLACGILFLLMHNSASIILSEALAQTHSAALMTAVMETTTPEFGFWGVSIFAFIALGIGLVSFLFDDTLKALHDTFAHSKEAKEEEVE